MLNFDTFKKYSKPGPRYTSYPTALEFSSQFKYDAYIHELKIQDPNRPLSLYMHLPFCRSACYFCACNVIFTSKEEKKVNYINYLRKELQILSTIVNTKREVIQLHFGGGTPTFFKALQLDEIIIMIKNIFTNFSDDAEISCEIDPRFINEEQMKTISKHGFNRVSFGVQDFDDKVQKAVHRIQPFNITKEAINLARKYNMCSINIDLIYGLPFQTLKSFKQSLKLALSLDPNRFAIFNYAHVPWLMRTMRKIDETTLPTPTKKLEILRFTIDYLTNNGYKMIGMDHFAKEEDELFLAINKGQLHRNFQGYTTKSGADLIGIGVTSIGEGLNYYAQNIKDLSSYEQSINEGKLPFKHGIKLNKDDKIRRYVIMELMSNLELDISNVQLKFDIDFKSYFKDSLQLLQPFVDDKVLTISNTYIKANETGAMLIRNIAMSFDSYMNKHIKSEKTFSKTI